MTFLIRFVSPTDPGIQSVPMIASDYEKVQDLFYKYFGRYNYWILDISIISYDEEF